MQIADRWSVFMGLDHEPIWDEQQDIRLKSLTESCTAGDSKCNAKPKQNKNQKVNAALMKTPHWKSELVFNIVLAFS